MFKCGTQIIYIPQHAEENIHHPDCEEGFITSVQGRAAFCRYWSKFPPFDLRTRANSELTSLSSLVICDTRPQSTVERALKEIGENG